MRDRNDILKRFGGPPEARLSRGTLATRASEPRKGFPEGIEIIKTLQCLFGFPLSRQRLALFAETKLGEGADLAATEESYCDNVTEMPYDRTLKRGVDDQEVLGGESRGEARTSTIELIRTFVRTYVTGLRTYCDRSHRANNGAADLRAPPTKRSKVSRRCQRQICRGRSQSSMVSDPFPIALRGAQPCALSGPPW